MVKGVSGAGPLASSKGRGVLVLLAGERQALKPRRVSVGLSPQHTRPMSSQPSGQQLHWVPGSLEKPVATSPARLLGADVVMAAGGCGASETGSPGTGRPEQGGVPKAPHTHLETQSGWW